MCHIESPAPPSIAAILASTLYSGDLVCTPILTWGAPAAGLSDGKTGDAESSRQGHSARSRQSSQGSVLSNRAGIVRIVEGPPQRLSTGRSQFLSLFNHAKSATPAVAIEDRQASLDAVKKASEKQKCGAIFCERLDFQNTLCILADYLKK
jgi:hypothetical protein